MHQALFQVQVSHYLLAYRPRFFLFPENLLMCQYFGPMLGIQTVLFQLTTCTTFLIIKLLHKKSHWKQGWYFEGSVQQKSLKAIFIPISTRKKGKVLAQIQGPDLITDLLTIAD